MRVRAGDVAVRRAEGEVVIGGDRMRDLTKTEVVLPYVGEGRYGGIEFVVADESGRSDGPIVTLSDERWQDMGAPKVITVTIEPGDRLNDG